MLGREKKTSRALIKVQSTVTSFHSTCAYSLFKQKRLKLAVQSKNMFTPKVPLKSMG